MSRLNQCWSIVDRTIRIKCQWCLDDNVNYYFMHLKMFRQYDTGFIPVPIWEATGFSYNKRAGWNEYVYLHIISPVMYVGCRTIKLYCAFFAHHDDFFSIHHTTNTAKFAIIVLFINSLQADCIMQDYFFICMLRQCNSIGLLDLMTHLNPKSLIFRPNKHLLLVSCSAFRRFD